MRIIGAVDEFFGSYFVPHLLWELIATAYTVRSNNDMSIIYRMILEGSFSRPSEADGIATL